VTTKTPTYTVTQQNYFSTQTK